MLNRLTDCLARVTSPGHRELTTVEIIKRTIRRHVLHNHWLLGFCVLLALLWWTNTMFLTGDDGRSKHRFRHSVDLAGSRRVSSKTLWLCEHSQQQQQQQQQLIQLTHDVRLFFAGVGLLSIDMRVVSADRTCWMFTLFCHFFSASLNHFDKTSIAITCFPFLLVFFLFAHEKFADSLFSLHFISAFRRTLSRHRRPNLRSASRLEAKLHQQEDT